MLGYLPSEGDGTPARTRSRSLRSSYADLQQLKTTPIVVSGFRNGEDESPTEGNGLHHRNQHRQRRPSLNDGVAVERISEIDQDDSFKEATVTINKENTKKRRESRERS